MGWTHDIGAANGLRANAARTERRGDREAPKPDLGARRGRGEAHIPGELFAQRGVGLL